MKRSAAATGLVVALAGCTSTYPLAPSPNAPELFHGATLTTDIAITDTMPEMLFVTDRKARTVGTGFGEDRSSAMAFGLMRVDVAGMTPAEYSRYMMGGAADAGKLKYSLAETRETQLFPGTPLPFALVGGVIERDRSAILNYQQESADFRITLATQLEAHGTGKVVLFVHGFNNSFETGAFNMLELWAASGWTGVPVMFSWPTQLASPLSYFEDTQDGAFSVFHLKETLRLVASTPEVETVTVVAHSHGASIASAALRELLIESRGAGQSMYDDYRIETLIMAAPDIDLGVMEQRLVAEQFGVGFGQINVYMNPDDNALGVAGLVFGNRRFGATAMEDLSPESRAVFHGVKSVHFIMVEGASGAERHNYFRLHPGALADIAMTIRTDARPADPERPLEHMEMNFWKLDRDYRPVFRDTGSGLLADAQEDESPASDATREPGA